MQQNDSLADGYAKRSELVWEAVLGSSCKVFWGACFDPGGYTASVAIPIATC